uniref:Uncharacterized protein n=1 Tax=viral metagenome TaxID=1070528 RepID=A0A6C0KCB2_9ZZZZ
MAEQVYIIAALLVLYLACVCATRNFTQVGETAPARAARAQGPKDIHTYIPKPSMYDSSLCGVFARMSSPHLDYKDTSLGDSVPLEQDEVMDSHKFLTQEIVNNTSNTALGKLRIMDLTGTVNRGKNVKYFELKAMLYNHYRSFATPILVEMFWNPETGFKIKRIKTKVCTVSSAYAAKPLETFVSPVTTAASVGYPEELDPVITQLLRVQNEKRITTSIPGTVGSGLSGQSLNQSYERPSDVARRFAMRG